MIAVHNCTLTLGLDNIVSCGNIRSIDIECCAGLLSRLNIINSDPCVDSRPLVDLDCHYACAITVGVILCITTHLKHASQFNSVQFDIHNVFITITGCTRTWNIQQKIWVSTNQ